MTSALAGDNAVLVLFGGWKTSKNLSQFWTIDILLAIGIQHFTCFLIGTKS